MTKKQSKATKVSTKQNAAARAAAIRKEQEDKERRVRTTVIAVVAVVVIAAIVAIGYAVSSMKDTTGQVATPPHGVVDKYGLPYGKSSAPVKVTAYEDFMCPICGDFEAGSRDMIKHYVDQGKVQVQYRMISFLDRNSSTKYSTRSENAVAVVLDTSGPAVAKKFHDLLYENQPQEGSAGLSDGQLTDFAVQAGAKQSDVAGAIKSLKFEQWVKNATEDSSKKGVTGTPTVLVNGKDVKFQSVAELPALLKSAIENQLAAP